MNVHGHEPVEPEPWGAYVLEAGQVDESLIGKTVMLPIHSYDTVADGVLVKITRTPASIVLHLRSRIDGRVIRYSLALFDEVRVYGHLTEVRN